MGMNFTETALMREVLFADYIILKYRGSTNFRKNKNFFPDVKLFALSMR